MSLSFCAIDFAIDFLTSLFFFTIMWFFLTWTMPFQHIITAISQWQTEDGQYNSQAKWNDN